MKKKIYRFRITQFMKSILSYFFNFAKCPPVSVAQIKQSNIFHRLLVFPFRNLHFIQKIQIKTSNIGGNTVVSVTMARFLEVF